MHRSTTRFAGIALAVTLAFGAAACGDDDEASTDTGGSDTPTTMASETPTSMDGEMMDSSTLCDVDAIVAAVEGGVEEGTLAGMTDDPVGTAASNNPVLTTLVTAVSAAGLVDTLNGAEGLTVFAPTDCAFAEFDPATLQAALDDPNGLLTEVLGYHVVTERLSPADLEGMTELPTFTGGMLPIEVDGDTITVGNGQATVLVPDIQTANATVYLIDAVMVPEA